MEEEHGPLTTRKTYFARSHTHDTIDKDHPMIIEIRAGEGGDDACLFVSQLATAYRRFLDGRG
jgi:protein subunit release factor A